MKRGHYPIGSGRLARGRPVNGFLALCAAYDAGHVGARTSRGRNRHVFRFGRAGRPARLPAPAGLDSECHNKLNGSRDIERAIRPVVTVRALSAAKGRLFKEDFTCFVKRLVLSLWPWW